MLATIYNPLTVNNLLLHKKIKAMLNVPSGYPYAIFHSFDAILCKALK